MNHTEIVCKLKSLVIEERKITADILKYLREVESRKIFAYMGYPSLFEFCLKELNYSEGAAQRRISAMRLIKELPQVEEKIVSGALSLTVASQAQTFFNAKHKLKKPMATNEKLNLLTSLEHTSKRECEKVLLQLEPETIKKDKERHIGPETLEIKITVERKFIENLGTLKNMLSHKMPFATTKDILSFALESLVEKHKFKASKADSTRPRDKVAKPGAEEKIPEIARKDVSPNEVSPKHGSPKEVSPKHGSLKEVSTNHASINEVSLKHVSPTHASLKDVSPTNPLPPVAVHEPLKSQNLFSFMSRENSNPLCQTADKQNNRNNVHKRSSYISIHTKRTIWAKGNGRCQYANPETGKRCESTRFLEIDHIVPKAHGGSNESDNLQLLCDTHNRFKSDRLMV